MKRIFSGEEEICGNTEAEGVAVLAFLPCFRLFRADVKMGGYILCPVVADAIFVKESRCEEIFDSDFAPCVYVDISWANVVMNYFFVMRGGKPERGVLQDIQKGVKLQKTVFFGEIIG